MPSQKGKVPGPPIFLGLCRFCKFAETCTFPRDPARPVRHCDEFCPVEGTPARRAPSRSSRTCDDLAALGRTECAEPQGLCANCVHREYCTFPKPPGGVWHCTEYQ